MPARPSVKSCVREASFHSTKRAWPLPVRLHFDLDASGDLEPRVALLVGVCGRVTRRHERALEGPVGVVCDVDVYLT